MESYCTQGSILFYTSVERYLCNYVFYSKTLRFLNVRVTNDSSITCAEKRQRDDLSALDEISIILPV